MACGVTSLGMDHVSMLGGTIESIAWQKAGIFKVLPVTKFKKGVGFSLHIVLMSYQKMNCTIRKIPGELVSLLNLVMFYCIVTNGRPNPTQMSLI